MKLTAWILAVALLGTTACTGSNDYGDCIGFLDDKQPGLRYEVNTWNVIWTVIFSETILVPIVWGLTCVKCPEGRTEPQDVHL